MDLAQEVTLDANATKRERAMANTLFAAEYDRSAWQRACGCDSPEELQQLMENYRVMLEEKLDVEMECARLRAALSYIADEAKEAVEEAS